MELAKAYDPKEAEQNHYKRWEDSGFFAPEINQDPDAEAYSIVTRQLKKEEHKTPQDIGREAFTEKVWEWKHKFGNEITRQIRREGLSVDWSRERFTMDPQLS